MKTILITLLTALSLSANAISISTTQHQEKENHSFSIDRVLNSAVKLDEGLYEATITFPVLGCNPTLDSYSLDFRVVPAKFPARPNQQVCEPAQVVVGPDNIERVIPGRCELRASVRALDPILALTLNTQTTSHYTITTHTRTVTLENGEQRNIVTEGRGRTCVASLKRITTKVKIDLNDEKYSRYLDQLMDVNTAVESIETQLKL